MKLLAISLALTFFGAIGPSALATHDAGQTWQLLRVADADRFLVAACDVQGEPPELLVVGATGRVLERLGPAPVEACADPSSPEVQRALSAAPAPVAPASAPASAPATPPLAERLAAHGLSLTPHFSAASPTRRRHLVVGATGPGVRVVLLDAGRPTFRRDIKGARGFGVGPLAHTHAAWHPEERWAIAYGSRVARLTVGVQHWEPFLLAAPLPPSRTAPADVARAWLALGDDAARRCERGATEACDAAEAAYRSALAAVPEHAAAKKGLERVSRPR